MKSTNETTIVAIDGPAGAGKSTVAKRLAAALGYIHLNSGALYRGVALSALQRDVSLDDENGLAEIAREVEMSFAEDGAFLLDGNDESSAIRTPEVDAAVAKISHWKAVRREVTAHQRRIASERNVVVEGRDVTTVVFPNAQVKIYLDATPDERANRRFLELQAKGESASMEEIAEQMRERDRRDRTRSESPLKIAPDATVVDTTGLTIEESVERIRRIVEKLR